MPTSRNQGTPQPPNQTDGERAMSPYAPAVSTELEDVELAILKALEQHARQMSDLLEMLREYGSTAVKSAVWHLIDRGDVQIEPDRSLKRAA
jgi:hypothetical protein